MDPTPSTGSTITRKEERIMKTAAKLLLIFHFVTIEMNIGLKMVYITIVPKIAPKIPRME